MKVKLIAETKVDRNAVIDWLVTDLKHPIESVLPYVKEEVVDAECLITLAGKRCYNSFSPDRNKNLSKVRTDVDKYIYHILNTAHGSVLEHVWFTFALEDLTLVATHELVRHRAGTAFSQQSLRYVRPDELDYRVPSCIAAEDKAYRFFVDAMDDAIFNYNELVKCMDLDSYTMKGKKTLTSALRRLLPNGIKTGMVFSANLRTLLNVVQTRTQLDAEEEIRELFDLIGKCLVEKVPSIGKLFEVKDGVWTLPFASMPHDAKKLANEK